VGCLGCGLEGGRQGSEATNVSQGLKSENQKEEEEKRYEKGGTIVEEKIPGERDTNYQNKGNIVRMT